MVLNLLWTPRDFWRAPNIDQESLDESVCETVFEWEGWDQEQGLSYFWYYSVLKGFESMRVERKIHHFAPASSDRPGLTR